MPEEIEKKPEEKKEEGGQKKTEVKPAPEKKKAGGKWFRKIPKEFLFSPGGVFLFCLAIFFEILDLFIPGGSLTFEIIPDLIFAVFLTIIAKIPFQSTLLPILIERIPIISDIVPTWFIKLLM